MIFDARGQEFPKPMEQIREHFKDNCKQVIDFQILVDNLECAKKAMAYSKMSKCKTSVAKAQDGEHYVITVKGESCSCA